MYHLVNFATKVNTSVGNISWSQAFIADHCRFFLCPNHFCMKQWSRYHSLRRKTWINLQCFCFSVLALFYITKSVFEIFVLRIWVGHFILNNLFIASQLMYWFTTRQTNCLHVLTLWKHERAYPWEREEYPP